MILRVVQALTLSQTFCRCPISSCCLPEFAVRSQPQSLFLALSMAVDFCGYQYVASRMESIVSFFSLSDSSRWCHAQQSRSVVHPSPLMRSIRPSYTVYMFCR